MILIRMVHCEKRKASQRIFGVGNHVEYVIVEYNKTTRWVDNLSRVIVLYCVQCKKSEMVSKHC